MAENETLLTSAVEEISVKIGKVLVLKDEQREAIYSLLSNKDVMAILPTGFGKSLIFQVFGIARSKQTGQSSTILVICPLQSIVNDQIIEAESLGLTAKSLDSQNKNSLLDDMPQLLFTSAEAVLNDDTFLLFKDYNFRRQIEAVVVDESHTIETWTGQRKKKQKGRTSQAFRGAYAELSTLRSFCKEGTPFMALTGTADKETQSTILELLALRNPIRIFVSPERSNIRISVKKCKKNEMFTQLEWLVDMVKLKGAETPKVIIFCNMMSEMVSVCNNLLLKLGKHAYEPQTSKEALDCLVDVFHSMTWTRNKERLLLSLKNKSNVKKRIVIASSALSMGVNFPDIRYVINWGPARSLLDYHQQAGRAGRDGKPSQSITIYHGHQASQCEDDVKLFIRAESCLRVASLKPFFQKVQCLLPPHSCCSNCSLQCVCTGTNCDADKLPFEVEPSGSNTAVPPITRDVSQSQRNDIQQALLEVKEQYVAHCSLEAHGFTNDLVTELTENCHNIFTISDVLQFPVFSIKIALIVLEIMNDIFNDIDVLEGISGFFCSIPDDEFRFGFPGDVVSSDSEPEDFESLVDIESW